MRPWGKLYKMRGVVNFQLSPFEQKAFYGFLGNLRNYIVNYYPVYMPYVVPPLIVGYMAADWMTKANDKLQRKDPKDYENDT